MCYILQGAVSVSHIIQRHYKPFFYILIELVLCTKYIRALVRNTFTVCFTVRGARFHSELKSLLGTLLLVKIFGTRQFFLCIQCPSGFEVGFCSCLFSEPNDASFTSSEKV